MRYIEQKSIPMMIEAMQAYCRGVMRSLRTSLRLDVINVFDQNYQIRNGTGVGVGAPQYGARRGYFAGVTKTF